MRIVTVLVCLVVSCVCQPHSLLFADNGRELILRASEGRSGVQPLIQTCSVDFSLVIVRPMSESQYREEASRRREHLQKVMGGNKEFERIFEGLEKQVRESQLTPQHAKGKYLYRFSVDRQRQSLFSIFYQMQSSAGEQSAPTTVLSESGPLRTLSVVLDAEGRTVHVLRMPSYLLDFYQMGRIEGTPINSLLYEAEKSGVKIIDALANVGYQAAGTKMYDDDFQMFLVEHRKGSRLVERYGIDPSRGFVCPVIHVYDEKTGNLVEEYVSKEFFLHASSGLWFPTFYSVTRYDASTGELVSKQECTIDSKTLKINQPVSEREFSIDVPAGFRVDDARTDQFIRYRADDGGEVSLTYEGLDFENMKWLSKELPIDDYVPSDGGVGNVGRIILMAIGIVIILIAVSRRIFRKWSKSQG